MSKTAKTNAKKSSSAKRKSKTEQLIGLLSRASGVTIEEMMKATGWQCHSVRGCLAGAIKKKGHEISSEVDNDSARHYHIKSKVSA